MSKSKPPLVRLSDLKAGESGDFFALLVERTHKSQKDGRPFYICHFRDDRRAVTCVVWSNGPWYDVCEKEWLPGRFYKIRGAYNEYEKYGPQIEIENLRGVTEQDKADGFDPLQFVDKTRYDVDAMFQELWTVAETQIDDVPLRRLVMTILERKKTPLKHLPATLKNFHPFAGGLIEHILSVTHSCIHLADKYVGHYPDLQPPLNRDLVVAGAESGSGCCRGDFA
jgi:3'-5' exoribonuclease